ncbi:MAG TPA: hypothetical protein VFT89_10670, partial [Rhizobiaceae bacterium]|nr:hypothetical protein [Rhizobiaceae bacterium]
MTNEKKFSEILFWAFCLVVFSKIVWYDVRVYWPAADRRDIMTSLYAGWIAAQGLVYLPILFPLLKQLRPAVLVFVGTVAPYLLLGALDGRINLFLIGDFARYGASVGFLLFSLWAVKNVPARAMLTAILTTMAIYFVLRLGLHLFLAEGGRMRFGRDWEVLLSTILVASAAMARGL